MPPAIRITLFTGLLTINMLLLSPMCHSHYLCLAIPAFSALLAWDWQNRTDDNLSRGLTGLMAVFLIATIIPALPGMVLLEDGGMGGIALLLVWVVGILAMQQARPLAARPFGQEQQQSGHVPAPHLRHQFSPSTSLRTSSDT
jgi:hypothetical protein